MLINRTAGIALCAGVGCLLSFTSSAAAQTEVTDFSDFMLEGTYGNWSLGNPFTSGPDDFGVESIGWGGGYYDIDPNVDATGNTVIELDVTVNEADPEAGLGVILVLVDEDITQYNYGQPVGDFEGWFGLLPGESYTLTASVDDNWWVSAQGEDGLLNISDLTYFHLQIDPGANTTEFYDVTFDNLRLVAPTVSVPGDANGDGLVDLLDLSVLASNFEGTDTPYAVEDGDFNGDGLVDLLDLSILASNFNAGGVAAPEPASASLLLLGGLLCRRR
ncbi:dockerin type I domain-containing protein [Mucisphaera calidilacus]|uniref:Dockerin domain-containing protein n=1 Tax=Mucisphaera calidilacus TaxID=2527982 RepID=A0A518BUA6_9BACT|nr:dockerin type I domain-containing protein [Mucisphaera calidilacus]QDU70572.1 hypothetical protein Pan265_04000 [Mucisphaera calidilacus]